MNLRLLLPTLLLCLPLAACNNTDSNKTDPATGKPVVDADSIGRKVKDATDKARVEIARGNIKISNDQNDKAEITPQGDLLINGKAVTIDAQQRRCCWTTASRWKAGRRRHGHRRGRCQPGVKAAGEALRGCSPATRRASRSG